VLFHLQNIGGLWDLREQPEWLFKIIKGPGFHASVFFLIGGFIFTIKFAEAAAKFDTWSFVKKRFTELFPLHCITTIMMAALKVVHMVAEGTFDLPKLCASLFMHLSLLWSLFPFGTYELNRPSWALSAFFLCYVLFGLVLKRVVGIQRKSICIIASAGCMAPILLWTLLFGKLGMPAELYHFFHTFAPVRFFEFLAGMLLARFFQLSAVDVRPSLLKSAINDLMIISAVTIIFFNLYFPNSYNMFKIYFAYHVILPPCYFIILFCLAVERGCIARLLSLPVIRKTGRSSFYPYLIHIPLMSILTFILERCFSYDEFLHRPLNVVVFTLLLYGGASYYVNNVRKRKPSGPLGSW
jgi:peptidoglycan/LPS O-acetylase OafA/YrhL